MPRPTLFRVLLQERRWDNWVVFSGHFEKAARTLATEADAPRLANVTVARRTFDRWFSGDWRGRPWPDTAQILEHLLGFPCADLFRPAPDVLRSSAVFHDRGGVQASTVISQRWPTSRLFLSATDEVADAWELMGNHVLDGTTAAVQFHPASRHGGKVMVQASDVTSLQRFLRPSRRGLVVGVDDGDADDDLKLYAVDSSNARRALSAAGAPDDALVLPTAYELDDLTYGILWALANLDDGLLADDQVLDGERQVLSTYLSLPRSAPSRLAAPALTSVGGNWLGSTFCAQHIQRRLQGSNEPPVFWTREQTGEEAAAWLFFRHKHDYLRALSERYERTTTPLSRTFCVPEAAVRASSRYERILLFLSIALMELHGIRVQVTVQPKYTSIDGFALVPGQRAVVANWVRTDALWAVDTVTQRSDLRGYSDVVRDAGAQGVVHGTGPETRLRTLAGYLDIDWSWLTRRCRELGECGSAGLIRPRSRLIGVDALDAALQFLGTLVPSR